MADKSDGLLSVDFVNHAYICMQLCVKIMFIEFNLLLFHCHLVLESQLSDVILSVHNNNVTLNEKDTLLLSCSSYGYPEPIVYWRRNNQAVVNSVRVKLSFVSYPLDVQQNYVNSTLRIFKLLPSDEGNYACIASNVKGTRMSSTSITVKREHV